MFKTKELNFLNILILAMKSIREALMHEYKYIERIEFGQHMNKN